MSESVIVQLSIETIENDKNAIRRMFPILFWGGISIMIIGVIVYFLEGIHLTNFDGFSIVGFGFIFVSFAFSNQQILHNDSYRKEIQDKINQIEGNLTLHLQKLPDSELLQSYDQFNRTLYFALGIAGLGIFTSLYSIFFLNNNPYWVEMLAVGFSLLIIATIFEQRFVDYYENSRIKGGLIMLEKYSKEILDDC